MRPQASNQHLHVPAFFANGFTLVHILKYGTLVVQAHVVEVLLARGADVNAVDIDGYTA